MGLFDKIKEFIAGEEESPVTAASVLAKVREKYPHLQGVDDLSLSQSLYKKDPAKFSYLKTYAPDTTVPPALVPKSMRDDAFYKANPQEGTKDALKVIEQVKSKFPKYKGVDAKRLAVALETKNPTMFAGLSKKLMPEQTAISGGEAEAAAIPLIPSGTMGATKPVSPVQVTAPVKPVVAKPEVRGRPTVVSISPMEAKLPAGTKPLKFKSGNEAYLAVEKLDKPTLVEYPNRHGQMIQRVLTKQSFETQPPVDAKKGITAKIVGKEEAFARGVGVSGAQVPELAYGATALVADSAEKLFGSGTASRVKDWALRGYQRASKVSEEVHGDEVKSVVESWKEAKKGNLDALGDWLSYWSGYGAGQLGESAAVAFLGGLVGSVVPGPGTAAGAVAGVTAKTATKGVIRGALERLVERQAIKLTAEGVAAAEAKRLAVKQIATAIGAASAIGAYAVVQEGGSIYPDAVKKAEEDGRKLNGYDLGRVWGTTLVAAGAEGLGDMLGLGFLTGKVRIPGRLGKVARIVGTAASGGLAGGGTEAIQTAVERVGGGRKPFDQAGIQDIIESAAAGAIPGLGAGGVGAIISGQPSANVQSLAATQEASPELLSYLDRVEKINRARLEMPEKLDLTPERPQMQPFVPAPPIPRSTAPVNEIVKTHAKSIMNEAVSEYNLERDRFSRWRDLIGPGLRPPRVLPGNRDVMGEYNTLPVWQKSGKGRFADEVAEEAVSVGLISKPEDIYDALRSLKAPSNPSRNVEDYYDEAQRFVDAEQPDTQPERKYPETEMPNFSASKKEDVTKGPARAEFIGYQEGLPEDTPIPLYNVMGESPRALSTVGSEELKSLGIETPKTPSFEEWKAGGDVTEGQVSAKKLIEKLASANEISDAVAVEFVKHITPTGENFYKSYGEEFSPEKFRVLGATIPQYTQNGLNFAIKLAQGAKESTGAHEMFHAMKQMGFFSQDEMRVLEGRFGNEEKIADALGEYATRRTGAEAQSRIKAIFDRFIDFVKRVGSMLVGRGWTRAEDIFESVVKGRPVGGGVPVRGQAMFKAEPKDQTQTPEFKRWFGNSKVVDADGKPLVVYHGSPTKFDVFDSRNMGNQGTTEGKGFYFTDDVKIANAYATEREGQNIKGEPHLFEVFLSIKNPILDINQKTITNKQIRDVFNNLLKVNPDALSNYGDISYEGKQVVMENAIKIESANESDLDIIGSLINGGAGSYDEVMNAVINATGIDGAAVKWNGLENGPTIYVAFKPTQIKSATGNSGTFDPNNPSILYQAERIGDIHESVYAENRRFKGSRSVVSKTGEFLTSAKDQAETLLTPISSVLADISPMLRVALRREAFREGLNRHNDTKAIIPFLEAVNKMRRDDAADLDLALKNGDSAKINQVIQHYGLEAEYAKVRKTLDAIHARAKEVGYDVGYLEEYWPRVIKDQSGFLKEIQADKKWPDIEKLIKTKEEELTRPLSEDEKVELINSYLRGYQNAVIALARTPNMKTRDIEVIGPGLNQHFRRFDDAVLKYVESMNHAIEAKRFFGRGGKDFFIDGLDNSIGGYVLDMRSQGLLKDARDEKRLRDILQAYFRPESMHGAMAAYKNATVSMTIGNAVAALTQLQDIGTSIYRAPVESVGALARAAVGGSKITLEDIGIDQIGEELRDSRKSAMFTSKVLRLAGLGKLDKITAETFINSVIRKYQKQARKPSAEFMDRIRNLVGPDTAKAIEDLKSGEITDLVKFIAFSEILGVQPKAMTELPRAYLSGGNARIFYALKTFQLRQIDMFRQEIFKKMAEPGLKNKIIGTRRLIALSSALLLAGVGTDELKDFILGRTTTLSDRIVDNILKLVGLSKWTLYKARQEGIASAAIKTILPPVPLVDQLWKDIRTAGDKKGLEVVQSIPLVGKFYYWWMGKGRFKKPLNDDMRWLKENAGRLGLTRSKAYQYLNRTSTRSLLAETEKERTEARAKVESYAKRLRAMAESREAELSAREERRKARLAARR